MTIIERSSGYWLVNDAGPVDGPFNTPEHAGDRKKFLERVQEYRMIVAAVNPNGEPDFYFCKVQCNGVDYENGEHYERAMRAAFENDYEAKLAFAQDDPAGNAMLEHFVWDSASVFTV